MSMLTPAGMGGKYRVTGRGYRPPPRRRGARVALLLALALAVLLGAAALWHFVFHHDLPGLRASTRTSAACGPGAHPRAAAGAPASAAAAKGTVAATGAATVLPPPKQVTVNVYNATGRQGLAAQVAADLRGRGFAVSQVANDPMHAKVSGPAEVRAGAGGASQLQVVMAQVAGGVAQSDTRQDNTVDLVLGDGFQALRDPAQANAALAPAAPAPAVKKHC